MINMVVLILVILMLMLIIQTGNHSFYYYYYYYYYYYIWNIDGTFGVWYQTSAPDAIWWSIASDSSDKYLAVIQLSNLTDSPIK